MSRTVRLRFPGASLISELLLIQPSQTMGHVTHNGRLASSASQPHTPPFPYTPKPHTSLGLCFLMTGVGAANNSLRLGRVDP